MKEKNKRSKNSEPKIEKNIKEFITTEEKLALNIEDEEIEESQENSEPVILAKKEFSDSQKEEVWESYYGLSKSWPDAFGRVVYKDNFICSHVFPLEKGGETKIANGIPLHPDSHFEKGDKLSGTVNNKQFEIKGNEAKGQLFVSGLLKTR